MAFCRVISDIKFYVIIISEVRLLLFSRLNEVWTAVSSHCSDSVVNVNSTEEYSKKNKVTDNNNDSWDSTERAQHS